MKKYIIGILGITGLAVLLAGSHLTYKKAYSISIIGGSDGPTSIFVAGKLGKGLPLVLIAAGVILLGIAAVTWIKGRK